MKILLLDNGSLRPESVFMLGRLAERLSLRVGGAVAPVSLAHANQIPAEALGGRVADLAEPFLRGQIAAGEREFVVLPLFIGPSRAVTEYLPQKIAALQREYPDLRVRVAPTLHREGDKRLAWILADRVREARAKAFTNDTTVRVAMVDHGSPSRAVSAVRDAVARDLADALAGEVVAVAPCSMERRSGSDFDFNEPLLENLLGQAPWNSGAVVVAQLFLQPGRHAGSDGDVAAICERTERAGSGLRLARTAVLGTHPLLIELLADRLTAALATD